MKENLDVFFSGLDVVEAVFHLLSGNKVVTGYFDNAFFDKAVGDVVLDTTQPRFTCKMSDVKAIPRETLVTINDLDFSVLQVLPEGTGMATVIFAHE